MRISRAVKRRIQKGIRFRQVVMPAELVNRLSHDLEKAARIARTREHLKRARADFWVRAHEAGKLVDWDTVGSVLAGPRKRK